MGTIALPKITRSVETEQARPIVLLSTAFRADAALRLSPAYLLAAKIMASFALVWCLLIGGAEMAAAQSFSDLNAVDVSGTSYHRFVRPGEATIEVLLLGNTGQSGIYVIGYDTDMAEFLALSGVGLGGSSGRESSELTVRLYRPQGTTREMVFEASAEDVLSAAANVPVFQDGDIIYLEVETRQRLSWLDIIRTASSFATLVLVADRLIRAVR